MLPAFGARVGENKPFLWISTRKAIQRKNIFIWYIGRAKENLFCLIIEKYYKNHIYIFKIIVKNNEMC